MIQQLIIKGAIKLIAKQFKLDKVLAYVEEDNELDNKGKDHDLEIHEMKARLRKLERSI